MNSREIADRADLAQFIAASGGGPHYVYVLRVPDGEPKHGGLGTPFYVGIGQGARLFAHEEEARDPLRYSAKVETIRSIWAKGGEVVRTIDSVHIVEPWDREEELINSIGRLAEGAGPLTNAQTYARSVKLNGIEVRKYAADHAESGDANAIPAKFKLRHTRLMAGPREPLSRTSVFGKIYTVVEANPGVTGEDLIGLLKAVDFSGNKSAYTQGGQVSSSWLVGYIEGGYFRGDRHHLQDYKAQ
ncbi:GIY-YIG nuclease family protein [Sphingobium sp. AP50]|uniref:GIY-YIG nuclease family protein n=1 Tax=Sphingobium sp. AP50 TaxID=1884369 RepID=UPI0011601E05|nr:GIY-YIG nuclease family protein [Sphingobium sp. AP50]